MRPLLLIFIVFSVFDSVYIFLTADSRVIPSGTVTLTGRISDKAYDDYGMVKSITIGNTLCYVNRASISSPLPIGSTVSLTGNAGAFKHAMNRGSFDASAYYRARNIDYYINVTELTVLDSKTSVKERFIEVLNKISNDVINICVFEGGTINTLLLGDKRNLPEDRRLIYSMAGVSHFLVISGLHVSAIGSFVYEITRRLFKKRIPACMAAVAVLYAYGFFVGFGISVIRAFVMYLIRLLSYILKRTYDSLSALSAAGIITLLIYPYALTDMSFIYSYLSVFIISCHMIYAKKLKGKSKKTILLNLFSLPVTLCAFLMPVTLYYSGTYSILAIAYNILLIPLSVPILVLAGLSVLFCEISLLTLAKITDFILHVILMLLDYLFHTASLSHLFSLNGSPTIYVIIIYYFLLVSMLIVCRINNIDRYSYRLVCFISLAVLCFEIFLPPSRISMLYVGQGECIVIKTGRHSAIISDCGSTSESNLTGYTIIPFLRSQGITHIDAMFISHPDLDHCSEAASLIKEGPRNGIKTDYVFYPAGYSDNKNITEIKKECYYSHTISAPLSRGDELTIKDINIKCLSPDSENLKRETNLDSLVLSVRSSEYSLLLTGDISAEIEENCLHDDIRSLILKIPHHGSSSSTGEALINATHPYIAIISAGINNQYNHPHQDVISRLNNHGIKTYVTRESGEIDITPFNRRLFIETYLK